MCPQNPGPLRVLKPRTTLKTAVSTGVGLFWTVPENGKEIRAGGALPGSCGANAGFMLIYLPGCPGEMAGRPNQRSCRCMLSLQAKPANSPRPAGFLLLYPAAFPPAASALPDREKKYKKFRWNFRLSFLSSMDKNQRRGPGAGADSF